MPYFKTEIWTIFIQLCACICLGIYKYARLFLSSFYQTAKKATRIFVLLSSEAMMNLPLLFLLQGLAGLATDKMFLQKKTFLKNNVEQSMEFLRGLGRHFVRPSRHTCSLFPFRHVFFSHNFTDLKSFIPWK